MVFPSQRFRESEGASRVPLAGPDTGQLPSAFWRAEISAFCTCIKCRPESIRSVRSEWWNKSKKGELCWKGKGWHVNVNVNLYSASSLT